MEMIGSVIGNRYEILEHIGSGGMAMVYKAKCRLLNRFVAVKILKPEFEEDEEFLRRFNTEAQAAASLSHTNIVSVYDVGKQGHLNYIVMEYAEGITLKEYMKSKGKLNLNEALDFSMQISQALEHAHSKRIVHRDIKPQNIVLDNNGTLKVTDFGLAKATSSATVVAEGSSALGSVHYASPEQARGGHTDERSDIYSLGVVMYEMFTGQLPYTGDSAIAIAMKHIQGNPVNPRMINDNIPLEIEEIILKCMAKYSHERYQSVSEVITALRNVGHANAKKFEEVGFMQGDIFSTRRLPDINKELKEKEEKESSAVKKKKININSEKIPQLAAIGVSVILIILIGFLVGRMFFSGGGSKEKIKVPSLIGQNYEEMLIQYKDQFEIIENQRLNNPDFPEGTIISQDPAEGEEILVGSEVNVVISLGIKTFELDDYKGEDYRKIENEIKKLDMDIDVEIIDEENDELEAGKIIKQKPAAGHKLEVGDKLTLYVSKGLEEIEMPSIVGKSEQEAKDILVSKELKVGTVSRSESTQNAGTVLSQGVEAGSRVEIGSKIDFVVSSGPSTKKTSRQISLSLPSGKESVAVKITDSEGNILYQQTHSTNASPILVEVSGMGKQVLEIYYDDVMYNSITVNFN